MRRLNLPPFALAERHRKFAREVGGVVLGVLIALAIGEVAEAARWQWRVGKTMVAIRSELSGNRYNFVERNIYQSCLDQRLKDIGQILQTARRTGALPTVENIKIPALRPVQSYAYQVALSEATPAHMASEKARELALFYVYFDNYGVVSRAEFEDWKTLALLQAPAGPVSDDLLAALLQAWSSASENAELVGLIAQQGDTLLKDFGIPVEYGATFPTYAALASQLKKSRCGPMLVNGRPYLATAG